jgi:glutathione peroxidase
MDQFPSQESTIEYLDFNVYDIELKSLEQDKDILKEKKGKVTMLVNVTGECANSAQYNIIQNLYDEYKDSGFEVVALPSTDFCQDAYGEFADSNASPFKMQEHMKRLYGTNLPFSELVYIKLDGENEAHDLYKKVQDGTDPIQGNFEKLIISKDGKKMKRFCNSDLLDLGYNAGERVINSENALINIKKTIEDFLKEDDKDNSN